MSTGGRLAEGPVRVAVDVRCELGEGALWHPVRRRLMWVDILRGVVFEAQGDGAELRAWGFDEPISALGWIDARRVAVSCAGGVVLLDLEDNMRRPLVDIEADRPETRSNDGRVGPDGAFWVSVMGRGAEAGLGAVRRVATGAAVPVEMIKSDMTIPNAICFAPDGRRAYLADSVEQRILTAELDPVSGAVSGPWDLFVDLSGDGLTPDGAVIDAEGCLWNAQWGAGRVARYSASGHFLGAVDMPAAQVTCPAFGGADLRTLFVTSAQEHMSPEARLSDPLAGAVFAVDLAVPGRPDPPFALRHA